MIVASLNLMDNAAVMYAKGKDVKILSIIVNVVFAPAGEF